MFEFGKDFFVNEFLLRVDAQYFRLAVIGFVVLSSLHLLPGFALSVFEHLHRFAAKKVLERFASGRIRFMTRSLAKLVERRSKKWKSLRRNTVDSSFTSFLLFSPPLPYFDLF